jgi:septal ring factor EnvC (AmiA/AmiB activator)
LPGDSGTSNNASEAEFKNLLADLQMDLADAKLEIAKLKAQLAERNEELAAIRKLIRQTGRSLPCNGAVTSSRVKAVCSVLPVTR